MEKSGALYIVSTPIGNLGDITLRALDTLQNADAILCEDTRVTGKLLAHYQIQKPLIRMDENIIREKTSTVIERLQTGSVLAYCSDAGMPGVSDPGMHLVRSVLAEGLPVHVLPGASAVPTAFVASGASSQRFLFAGFLPRKAAERMRTLEQLRGTDAALIFYESPHRLVATLNSIAEVFPQQMVSVCRELTKLHEEVVSGSASEMASLFTERERNGSIKGEIVVVVDATLEDADDMQEEKEACARCAAQDALAQGMRPKDIARQLTDTFGIARNTAYDIVLQAKEGSC